MRSLIHNLFWSLRLCNTTRLHPLRTPRGISVLLSVPCLLLRVQEGVHACVCECVMRKQVHTSQVRSCALNTLRQCVDRTPDQMRQHAILKKHAM